MTVSGFTYTTTRHHDTNPNTGRAYMWVVVTRSDGLKARSSNWTIDDGSAEAEAGQRMAALEATGGYAPIEVRDAARAMMPSSPAMRRAIGPDPSDVRWRVSEALRLWEDKSTVASIRERIAITRKYDEKDRVYLAALQAELDLSDKVLDAIESGLSRQSGGGGA